MQDLADKMQEPEVIYSFPYQNLFDAWMDEKGQKYLWLGEQMSSSQRLEQTAIRNSGGQTHMSGNQKGGFPLFQKPSLKYICREFIPTCDYLFHKL